MLTLSSDFQEELDSMSTQLCYCVKVTTNSGHIYPYTDSDVDISFDSTTYLSEGGFSRTTISETLDLSVNNLEISGAYDSNITLSKVESGHFEKATIVVYLVDIRNVSNRILKFNGVIGESTFSDLEFSLEARSKSTKINQSLGRVYQRRCPYSLGDSDCRFDLSSATLVDKAILTVSSASVTIDNFTATDGDYDMGYVLLSTGKKITIRSQVGNTLNFWTRLNGVLSIGDTVNIVKGCIKDSTTCKDKFNNLIHFGGFEYIPTEDTLSNLAVQGKDLYDGGSMWK